MKNGKKSGKYQATSKRGKTKNISEKSFNRKIRKLHKKNPGTVDLFTIEGGKRDAWAADGKSVSKRKMKKGGKIPKAKSNYNGWDIQPS